MSAFQAPAQSAIALQLTASVKAYQEDASQLLAAPLDGSCYDAVSRRMDEMRMYSASLPQLSAGWVELLIRHFEYTHALWRAHGHGIADGELQVLHDRLQEAAGSLSHKAASLIATHR